MKKPRGLDAALAASRSALREFLERRDSERLARASRAILAGRAVDAGDRALVAGYLVELCVRARARDRAMHPNRWAALVADHLTRALRIPRGTAALLVSSEPNVPNVVRAIARLRRARHRVKSK